MIIDQSGGMKTNTPVTLANIEAKTSLTWIEVHKSQKKEKNQKEPTKQKTVPLGMPLGWNC
jgi:hypothetical protein